MKHETIKFVTHLLKPISTLVKDQKNELNQRTVLTYHGISKKPQFNCVKEYNFVDQMAWLKENYSVVSLFELVKRLKSPLSDESNLVSITFDDGYINFAELAVPVLEKYGFHATVFIPAGKVGHFNDWDESNSNFHKMSIMTFEQLRQLSGEVVEIGSHGISHIPLDQLSFEEVVEEIGESRLKIEEGVGKAVRFFSFPFGAYPRFQSFNFDGRGMKLMECYYGACTSRWGRYNSIRNVYSLRRIGIWETDSFKDFLEKLRGDYDWLVAKEKIGRFYKSLILGRKG